ncbi:MAG: GMC family oxidoreductase [Ignavibacteriae bacterium]|nr:GMC family oxidoreductase [Ignavibacteriota bacterium]
MFFDKRWEPSGLDSLSTTWRMILSILITGIVGFALEYVGIEVLDVFENASPMTIYAVIGIWAFGLGPLLVLLRKSALWVPMAIVGGAFAFLVLFNHYFFMTWEFGAGGFHSTGKLWAPRIWEFREGAIFGLQHPLLIAIVAGVIETIVVPVSVLLQQLIVRRWKKPAAFSLEEETALFRDSVVGVNTMKPRRDFGFYFMRFIFFAYGTYFVYMLIGLMVNGRDLPVVGMFFINPPETINTIMKITLMVSLANLAAFNAGVRREAALLLTIGHLISVGASLGLYFAYPVNPLFPDEQSFLLSSVIGDGALLVVLVYYLIAPSQDRSLEETVDAEVRSPASSFYRLYFLAFASLFSFFTAAILYFRIAGAPESGLGAVFGGPDPLVSNSLTKYGTLAAFGWFLYKRDDMRRYMAPTLVIAFSFSLLATIIYGLQGSTVLFSRNGVPVTLPWFMVNHLIVDGGGLALLLALRRLQYHVDLQITALKPGSAECVVALHQALRESSQAPELSAKEVVRRIDEYIVGIRGRRRGLLAFPFWLVEHVFPVLLFLRPAFSVMSRDEQRWMLRRYMLRARHERVKAALPALAEFLYQIGDICHALVTLSYFTTQRSWRQVGYVEPDARERLQGEMAASRPPLGVDAAPLPDGPTGGTRPSNRNGERLLSPRTTAVQSASRIPSEVDYCIIGSGAAGGLLAYRLGLAKGNKDSICVLERGGYYSPQRDFSDDEMKVFRTLYTDGGLQVSRSFDFTVLQGECVGGTTVINNAVCFQMPEIARGEWGAFGFDADDLGPHYQRVADEINIGVVADNAVNARVEQLFTEGVKRYNDVLEGLGPLQPAQRNSGNFLNCTGCGLCNCGCKYMRKLSVLETYIPWAISHGVSIVSSVSAVRCEVEKNGGTQKAKSVIVRTENGGFARIKVRKAVIVAAGAIASSRFLMRSELGGSGVGQGLSCNYAVPPVVIFDEPVNAFDGLQMAMYARPESQEAVFETTFFPPGSYAISFPQYFEHHAQLMSAYPRAVNFTALVGSDPAGSVSRERDVLFGRAIQWSPTASDLNRMRKSLITIIQIAQASGAKEILLPTHPVLRLHLDKNIGDVVRMMEKIFVEKRFFNFVTAHPQGGNMMASDSIAERVVELDFRVRDCANVYVCDASVFPRGIRVNPQWTIMALASLASERIAAGE